LYWEREKGGDDKMKKRQWLKPILTILVRRKNAENILTSCHGAGATGAKSSIQGYCSGSPQNCSACG